MYSLKARAAAKLIDEISPEERVEILNLLRPTVWTVMRSLDEAAGQMDMDETDTWVGLSGKGELQLGINTIIGVYSSPEKAYRAALQYEYTQHESEFEDFIEEDYYFTKSNLNSLNLRYPKPLSQILPQSIRDRIVKDLIKNNPR